MRKFVYLILIVSCVQQLSGQVRQNIDQDRLEKFKEKILKVEQDRAERVGSFLKENPTIKRVSKQGGDYMYLKDVINGKPIYVSVYNVGAAQTTNTSSLQTNGNFGINLTGSGMKVGVWDGGYNRRTHQEYTGRTIIGDGNEYGVSDHATHVMGTILASGVNPSAKGMATEARGVSYGFGNDLAEMTAAATTATDFLILSNHSYGIRAGWNDEGTQWLGDPEVSQSEDWRFGYYDSDAANTDELMYIAPYYLSVWAAGNQRGQTGNGPYPANGPYDVLVGDKTAKNTLVVGAVNKITGGYSSINDVVMSSFSCWGPTDDGRIKPDIVGAGVGIYSATNVADDSYGYKQGTSMSTPNVTGSLMLIQQLYKKLNAGNVPRSATVKAMAFHTANDGGTVGPDYVYGWGLLNAEGMAELLMSKNNVDKVVRELVLIDGEDFELEFEPAANTEVKATIVWTDLPGVPGPSRTLDGTKLMLINDLDMRISQGETAYQPWILNPGNPGAAAQKGDNFRDNSEQVVFTSANDQIHKLSISHKSVLETGQQAYSLVLTYTPKVQTKTYYWIGVDGGDWNDVNNWSLSSGGSSVNAVPSSNDNVIFDDNSFANDATPSVTLTENVDVASIKWLAPESASFVLSDFTLTLTAGLVLDNPNISFGSGDILLLGSQSTESDLVLDGLDLSSVNVTLNSPSTLWSLIGDISINSLNVVSGTLDLTKASLEVGNFIKTGLEPVELNVSNTSLILKESLDFSAGNVSLIDNGTRYIIPEGKTVAWASEDLSYNGYLSSKGILTLNGSGNTWDEMRVEAGGVIGFGSSLTIGGLELEPGSSLDFQSDIDLTILSTLTAVGTTDAIITLSGGANAPGKIIMDGHKKVCLDYLSIEGVEITGTASVTAGVNSSSDNTSWVLVSCENLLYSDFEFAYTCLSSLTMFTDLSTGAIDSWAWDFGDGNSSSDQNPNHEYTSTGTYNVTLEVGDGNEVKVYTQELVVGESDLASNTVVNNNGVLASVQQASSYQWYRDGELIQGATQRTYDTQEQNGVYFVLTFSEGCNLMSNEVEIVVTGIEEQEQELLNRGTSILPNPAQDSFEVSMLNDLFGDVTIKILTLNGVEQVNFVDKKLDKEYIHKFNIKTLSNGVYIVRVAIEGRFITKKLLIK